MTELNSDGIFSADIIKIRQTVHDSDNQKVHISGHSTSIVYDLTINGTHKAQIKQDTFQMEISVVFFSYMLLSIICHEIKRD